MPREIVESRPVVLSSKSFDGKHTIQFNEASHRYKLDGKACVGTTTMIKAAMPTSMGLVSWMKGQALQHLWEKLTVLSDSGVVYHNSFTQLNESDRIELFKAAKNADKKPTQEAADAGTIIHDYCYLIEAGKKDEAEKLFQQVLALPSTHGEKIVAGIDKFKAWKETNKDELISAEELIASPSLLYCGKFDRLARRNDRLVLSDFKTSNGIYVDHFVQLGAYALALKEWKGLEVQALEVLRFGKNGGEFETLLIADPKELKLFEEQAIRCRQTYDFLKMNSDPRFEWKGKK